MISYKKMSLFDAPEGSILAHGCNAQGVWGSGIAAPFKDKYPRSWKEYNTFCLENFKADPKYGAVGRTLITHQENKRFVGCLITSLSYGRDKDTPDDIIAQTYLALDEFFQDYLAAGYNGKPIYSNKFNSGMFKVDWARTEKVLQYFVKRYDVEWVVCDPEMEFQ